MVCSLWLPPNSGTVAIDYADLNDAKAALTNLKTVHKDVASVFGSKVVVSPISENEYNEMMLPDPRTNLGWLEGGKCSLKLRSMLEKRIFGKEVGMVQSQLFRSIVGETHFREGGRHGAVSWCSLKLRSIVGETHFWEGGRHGAVSWCSLKLRSMLEKRIFGKEVGGKCRLICSGP